MKQEFISYLESIGMQSPLIKIVEEKYKIAEMLNKSICDYEINDIFIEESFDESDKSEFKNIVFISCNVFIELGIFSNQITIRSAKSRKSISGIDIDSKNYDWETWNANSKMSIRCLFPDMSVGTYAASGVNCERLKHLITKYILPDFDID